MNDSKSDEGEANDCIYVVNQLRSMYQQFGTPEPHTVESTRIYQLLFGTSTCQSSHQPQAAGSGDADASPTQDLHFGVDVTPGPAFGPSKGTKATQSPYAKGPASHAAGCTGKGNGVSPGDVTPSAAASQH